MPQNADLPRDRVTSVLRFLVPLIIIAALTVPIALLLRKSPELYDAFYVFAALPAVVGLLHHVGERHRFEEGKADAESRAPGHSAARSLDRFQPTASAALTSCLILYIVFLLSALIASTVAHAANTGLLLGTKSSPERGRALMGMIFAGYGAYVSTLWYMLGRINANALSARFLVNSALKAAAAMVLGFVLGHIGIFKALQSGWDVGALFLTGMFQAWAMGYLRQKAVEVFGVKQKAAEDLPVQLISGVDDAAADLLDENGIATVQHLATSDPIELSFRTLYPLDRTLDWIDQAILTIEFGGEGIVAMRQTGIRTVTQLVSIYQLAMTSADPETKNAASETLKLVAQKIGLPEGTVRLKAALLDKNRSIDVIESLWSKKPEAPPVGPSMLSLKPQQPSV
ncbi:MAG TPA: hypothetical protein VFN10_02455 [Thermoanaerobaculia bacterium]|nr:hypothetical protein [Thermoanaerobaculia bacterium]